MRKIKPEINTKKIVAFSLALIFIFVCTVFSAGIFKRVTVVDGDTQLQLNTYTTSTRAILAKADITLDYADKVNRKEHNNKILITVLRAFPVHIIYHNLEHVEFMTGGTVSDALIKAGITLGADDVINTSGETMLYDGINIVIDEVRYITKTKTKKLKFGTVCKESDDYPQGYEQVTKKGKNGQSQISTTYRYVNGELDTVVSQSEEIVSQPVSQVVTKGTAKTAQASNISSSTISTSNSNAVGTVAGMSYTKVLTGSATAYTADAGALTSTGIPAYVGGVAVNPNVIPYGSKLYIVADGYTYGYATAVDTGGALMSGSALVDLYMSSYDECINFGRRNVKVYVLS